MAVGRFHWRDAVNEEFVDFEEALFYGYGLEHG